MTKYKVPEDRINRNLGDQIICLVDHDIRRYYVKQMFPLSY